MDWAQILSSNNLFIIKQNVFASSISFHHIYKPFLFLLTFDHHQWEVKSYVIKIKCFFIYSYKWHSATQ